MTQPRQPVFNVPGPVIAVLLLLAAIHLYRQTLPLESDLDLIARWAFVPLRLTALFDQSGAAAHVATLATASGDEVSLRFAAASFFLRSTTPAALTLVSYAFLHGDWVHLGMNSLWLLAFGTPVARRFGPLRFTIFLLTTAVAGALAHWACFPFGTEPVIGASAAVSGCMGAAIRFAFMDRTTPLTGEPSAEGYLTLLGVLRNRRALSFVAVWFVTNALFGLGSFSAGLTAAPVAWQAHIGGFVAGLALFRPFDRRTRTSVSSREQPPGVDGADPTD